MSGGKTNSQMRVSAGGPAGSLTSPLPRAATISSRRGPCVSISQGPTPRTADSSRSDRGRDRAMPASVRLEATRNAGQPSSPATSERQARSAS